MLDLDDIQAHVVPGFAHQHQRLVGFGITADDAGDDLGADAVRRLLRRLVPEVTPARRGLADRAARRDARRAGNRLGAPTGDPAVGLALSPRCLAVLGDTGVAALDEAFGLGMADRSYLRDPPQETWEVGAPGAEIDLLVIMGSDDEQRLADAAADLRAAALSASQPAALRVVHDQPGSRLPGEIEHFGFRDGISQPVLRGLVREDPLTPLTERTPMPPMPDGRDYAGPGDVLVWPGQFLLGLPRQSEQSAHRPSPPRTGLPELARGGSFLVYRKLAQDVGGFYADTARMAAELDAPGQLVDPDLLRALLVGRWPDGWPLVRDKRDGDAASRETNHFGYDSDVPDVQEVPGAKPPVRGATADPDGLRCPLAAHIRKVNPRDQETDKGGQLATLTFAILRRGIPYGPRYDHDDPDASVNTEDRGLLFLCYQTDLTQQFELLITDWANQDDRPRQGPVNGLDLIIGRTKPRDPEPRTAPLHTDTVNGSVSTMLDYVTTRGGAYLFTPSISALRSLAEDSLTGR